MSKTRFPQVAALVLAVIVTSLGVASTDAIATQQYARAAGAAADDLNVASVQTVVVVARRA